MHRRRSKKIPTIQMVVVGGIMKELLKEILKCRETSEIPVSIKIQNYLRSY
jgi:hypothetical protein